VIRPSRFMWRLGNSVTLVDADGCCLDVGLSTYVPWRWGHITRSNSAKKCLLSKGVRMTDPEAGTDLPRYHEIAFEV